MVRFAKVAAAALFLAIPGLAIAQDLIPEKRTIVTQDADLPGGDIASIFDTSQEACERACLTNKSCDAYTFNTRNGSCFLKADPGAPAFFQGAMSAVVVAGDPAVRAAAAGRRGDVSFVYDYEITNAVDMAATMGRTHTSGAWSAEEHLQAASENEAQGNWVMAMAFTGAALNITDDAGTWLEYARRALAASRQNGNDRYWYENRAYLATVNAYLRADSPALRHSILVQRSEVQVQMGRGRDMVQALRLAQQLQPRDDTAALLDVAIGKYGFRMTDNTVEADLARPRICAWFSENLVPSDADYSTYVKLPQADLAVEIADFNRLCIVGLTHGSRSTITFREGLPSADGQVLAKDVAITSYIRDRNPGVSFAGRGYVLPKLADAALPVQTVNRKSLHNPVGAFRPPKQEAIEAQFRKELRVRHGVEFTHLYTITNMPVSRYLELLVESGNYEQYMERLANAFNPAAVAGVMCLSMISIGWDGTLYDCDFNQMLELPVDPGLPSHIRPTRSVATESTADRHAQPLLWLYSRLRIVLRRGGRGNSIERIGRIHGCLDRRIRAAAGIGVCQRSQCCLQGHRHPCWKRGDGVSHGHSLGDSMDGPWCCSLRSDSHGNGQDLQSRVDDSLSMRARFGSSCSETRFDHAVSGARQLLSSAREGDGIAIVAAGAPARVILTATTDLSSATRALDSLRPSDRPTDLDTAMAMSQTLAKSLPHADRGVVLFSDPADGQLEGGPLGKGLDVPVWIPQKEIRGRLPDCGVVRADRKGARITVLVACGNEKDAEGRKIVCEGSARDLVSAPLAKQKSQTLAFLTRWSTGSPRFLETNSSPLKK